MEEVDDNVLEARPSTSRRVPAGFDADEPSPAKDDSDDKPRAALPNEHPLRKENIPLLPPSQAPPTQSSFVDQSIMDDGLHADSMTEEQQVRAHLSDIESSFARPISPIPVSGPEGGIDDTFLFDGARQSKQVQGGPYPTSASPALNPSSAVAPAPTNTRPEEPRQTDAAQRALHGDTAGADRPPSRPPTQDTPLSQPRATPHDAQPRPRTPMPESQAKEAAPPGIGGSNSTSELESLASSPTAQAAARTVDRAISMAVKPADAHNNEPGESGRGPPTRDGSKLTVPNNNRLSAGVPALRLQSGESSDVDLDKLSADAGHTPGQALKFGKRPKYLRSRHASQRSSTSSFSADDVESDGATGLGADFAIQTGGAIPSYGMPRSISDTLSRSISMGSMASGIDDSNDSSHSGRMLDPLGPLEEIESPPRSNGHRASADDMMATPKARKEQAPNETPTDTVIARRVRNVEVPESVVREFRSKGGLSTPVSSFRKMSDHTPAAGTASKNGRNLTLKEQSSTIDRLSKENFDLKLKVMFLSDRLEKISEEGVKEMISENVELKTSLAVIQRDNKMLRRRVKELEKRLLDRDDGDRPSTARSGYSSEGGTEKGSDPEAREREEELLYLRERVEEFVSEIEELKSENMAKEAEKRKLAEVLKNMGDRAGERIGDNLGRQEEADVFKDLLEQETARREQADDDNRKLRDEVFRLKQEVNTVAAGGAVGGPHGMHHTTNIYNITRKGRPTSPSRSRPGTGMSARSGEMDQGPLSQASTLVEELRRESEQLRHENAELRREVGAQTSMLTSRNREKERLYQEIEDLKLASRRGGAAPSVSDSLLDRSASRSGGHERPSSRATAKTNLTMAVEDPEREELEEKLAEYRDKMNEMKMQNQELQRELEGCMEDFETAVNGRRQAEENAIALEEDLNNTVNDLMVLQAERDEVLQDHASLENEFENLKKEAQEEIDALEGEADQRNEDIQRLHAEIQERSENFDALQEEMRKMSEVLIRLEDEHENKHRRIEQLEHDLNEANKELEELESKLVESNEKASRLTVQQESGQHEVSFLREEQEGDKIRIGDLEAALANCEQGLRDERERAKELDVRLANERRQREIIATREKEEVQEFVNDLNREMTSAKDEARRLRKNLTSREVEATEWKERLLELENNLREALGDLNGTRSSLLKGIASLQRELENTVRDLNTTKATLLEKERTIKQRDALLESHGLESRKLSEMLDKERQGHRNTKNAFETFQRTHQHVSRTVTSQDGRILELETQRASDKKKLAQLEASARDQLTERNNMLLILWTRLSALCGSDWAHGNSLIDGRALPSLEAVSTMLPGFSKNLLGAVKKIEQVLNSTKDRIRQVEKDLWKEYQTLENNLEVRSKKLERLEALLRHGVASGSLDFNTATRISQLEAKCRALKMENATLMRANDAKTRAVGGYFDQPGERELEQRGASAEDLVGGGGGGGGGGDDDDHNGSPSPNIPTGPTTRQSGIPRSSGGKPETAASSSKSRTSTMTSRNAGSSTNGLGISLHNNNNNGRSLSPNDQQENKTPRTLSRGSTWSLKGLAQPRDSDGGSGGGSGGGGNGGGKVEKDNRWMFRLRELEHKLKQEREERNLDRAAARQRIREEERQREELARELVRVKRRGGGGAE